jgi:hypothetical protein
VTALRESLGMLDCGMDCGVGPEIDTSGPSPLIYGCVTPVTFRERTWWMGDSPGRFDSAMSPRNVEGRRPRFVGMRASKRRRDTVWEMDTFEALRERVLYPFEALGPSERKGVDLVPLFLTASS